MATSTCIFSFAFCTYPCWHSGSILLSSDLDAPQCKVKLLTISHTPHASQSLSNLLVLLSRPPFEESLLSCDYCSCYHCLCDDCSFTLVSIAQVMFKYDVCHIISLGSVHMSPFLSYPLLSLLSNEMCAAHLTKFLCPHAFIYQVLESVIDSNFLTRGKNGISKILTSLEIINWKIT